jgi:hypothetical protein
MEDKEIETLMNLAGVEDWEGQYFYYTFRFTNSVTKSKSKRTVEAGIENHHHFMKRLNRKVFGSANAKKKRSRRRSIKYLATVHCHLTASSLHLHGVMNKPKHIKRDDFSSLVKTCWLNTSFGYLGRNDSGFAGKFISKDKEVLAKVTKYIYQSKQFTDVYPLKISI